MQKILIGIFCLLSFRSYSQEITGTGDKNIIKLNLTALAFKNVSVQYERAVGRKTSVAALVRFMPETSVPFKGLIKSVINEPETEEQLDNAQVGNFAFTPEFRYYLGKKGAFHGLYIAPFVSLARYKASLNYLYTDLGVQKSIPLSGGVTTFTGGLLFGGQWKLGSQVYLDLWFLGPTYGTSNGDVTGQKSLNASEQNSLRRELEDLELPLTRTTYEVDSNGATVFFKGPWAGVRSGISLGIGF